METEDTFWQEDTCYMCDTGISQHDRGIIMNKDTVHIRCMDLYIAQFGSASEKRQFADTVDMKIDDIKA